MQSRSDVPEDRIFHALADPSRRAIFESLTQGEASVNELTGRFHISQPAVSQHLAALKDAGLVRRRREGRCAYYSVEPEGLIPLIDWIALPGILDGARRPPGRTSRENGRMNPVETTDSAQSETLSFEFDLRHTPEKVWRALTEPELLSEWLLPVVGLRVEAGASFTLQSEPQPGWDGKVDCEFLEIDPKRSLSYRWVVGDIDTVVTFTLEPTGTGTSLKVVQSGFKPDQKRNFGGARYGWRMMGERLVELLEREEAGTT